AGLLPCRVDELLPGERRAPTPVRVRAAAVRRDEIRGIVHDLEIGLARVAEVVAVRLWQVEHTAVALGRAAGARVVEGFDRLAVVENDPAGSRRDGLIRDRGVLR